jgi:hypothetical protein
MGKNLARRPVAATVSALVLFGALVGALVTLYVTTWSSRNSAPVVAVGRVTSRGAVKTEVCIHPGIVELAPCGFAFTPTPLETVEVREDGTFELHADIEALPDALLGVDVETAKALDRRADFPDRAIRDAEADIKTAKAWALELGAIYGPGTYRVATVIASRVEVLGFFDEVYCARKIIVVKESDAGGWADLSGHPIFGLGWNQDMELVLAPDSECWENSPL